MGDPGQDQGVHAEVEELVEAFGHLVVVPDQAEGGAVAERVEPAPHVRRDLQGTVVVAGLGEEGAAAPHTDGVTLPRAALPGAAPSHAALARPLRVDGA